MSPGLEQEEAAGSDSVPTGEHLLSSHATPLTEPPTRLPPIPALPPPYADVPMLESDSSECKMPQGQDALPVTPPPKPTSSTKLRPIPGLLPPCIDINALNNELQSFNNLLAFAPLGGSPRDTAYARIHKDLIALREKLVEARNTIGRVQQDIQRSATKQAKLIPQYPSDEQWYLQSDLLSEQHPVTSHVDLADNPQC